MQTARIVQAVALMLIVALAASCAASKEYSSKLFGPRPEEMKDSQAVALRFLELDKLDPDQENWVTTDIIMGRDTGSKTLALDKLAQVFPASRAGQINTGTLEKQAAPVYVNSSPLPSDKMAATKTGKKKPETSKTVTVSADKTPVVTATEPVTDQPVAKNYNSGETREKRTREDKE